MVDPDGIDADIREALAQALGERKVRLTDRRLLILFVCLVAALAWLGLQQRAANDAVHRANVDRQHFEQAAVLNCHANRRNTVKFNAFVGRIVEAYRTSPVLTPQQQRERADFFAGAKQVVPKCPPAPLGVK